jgi:hypothetical protein
MLYPAIIVKNEIISARDYKLECPFCKSENISDLGGSSTMVGFNGQRLSEQDPNHYWYHKRCGDCGENFIKQQRGGKVWITTEEGGSDVLLSGMPNCFEPVTFKCSYCGGYVIRSRMDLEAKNEVKCLSYENGKKMFRTFYRCDNCKKKEEASNE